VNPAGELHRSSPAPGCGGWGRRYSEVFNALTQAPASLFTSRAAALCCATGVWRDRLEHARFDGALSTHSASLEAIRFSGPHHSWPPPTVDRAADGLVSPAKARHRGETSASAAPTSTSRSHCAWSHRTSSSSRKPPFRRTVHAALLRPVFFHTSARPRIPRIDWRCTAAQPMLW